MAEERIIWLSRHLPTTRQKAELEVWFPSHTLIIDQRSFDGADDIAARYVAARADLMVLVAPYTVIRALRRRGITILHAQMEQCRKDDPLSEVQIKGRHYKFVQFNWVNRVDLDMTPLSQRPPLPSITHMEAQPESQIGITKETQTHDQIRKETPVPEDEVTLGNPDA